MIDVAALVGIASLVILSVLAIISSNLHDLKKADEAIRAEMKQAIADAVDNVTTALAAEMAAQLSARQEAINAIKAQADKDSQDLDKLVSQIATFVVNDNARHQQVVNAISYINDHVEKHDLMLMPKDMLGNA